jgi:hypothetical protein
MARRLPTDVVWTEIALEREDVSCGACGRRMRSGTPFKPGLVIAWF